MSNEIITRAGEIVGQSTVNGGEYNGQNCVLSLIDLEGYPTSSVITAAKSDGIKWLTFCTGLGGNKPKRIEKCNRASVCFGTGDYNISLVGEIEVITDAAVKEDTWYKGMENHFSGSDDPNYCVLKFTTKSYNLLVDWQEASGKL
ncbi:MAG: pyridoxamine 5'-phosphate oxidase family protein [Oscillospiraceae bacterium]|nr:pyridoxamine 5'-phosphate oxidase family protein [Oscillospiraceae bacterium]